MKKMSFRRATLLLSFLMSLSLFCGCKKDIDPDFFCTMVFENHTCRSLNVTMSHYPHLNSDEAVLFSLDIVAGASSSGKITEHALYELSTCTVRFDDGKKLEYHRERNGEIADPSNPLNPLAYEFKKIDDVEGSLTFSITDAHYLQGE